MRIHSHSPRGAALIIVLACLIFVTVIAVAFLSSMRSKLVTSKASADANEVRMLADTAVNIAIAQVTDATLTAGATGAAWASQPGMIRLYNASGNAAGFYKLYSSNIMTGSGAFTPADDAVPTNWAAQTALFTDLNAPVNGVFPIFDYNRAVDQGVEAIDVESAPGGSTANPAPMPVRWLYVLADGSLHAPGTASTGTVADIPAATEANPIVGRIAFWADDETCKVNLNTASVALAPQGLATSAPYGSTSYNTFWDTPHFSTPTEHNLARFQPAQGEYQRYPGHPATVGLNAIFPVNSTTDIESLFAITPRSAYDGSKGATVPVTSTAIQWIDRNQLADRLYASVDEVLFRDIDRARQGLLNKEKVQASKFFLTTSSRAPELNLFGRPRVSMWPIDSTITSPTSTRVSTLDRLLAFCSTVGAGTAHPFYFTRSNALSATADIQQANNLRLLSYLDDLTGRQIPGFGGSFQAKFTQAESRQILTLIFDYIRTINTQDSLLPGLVQVSNQWNNPNWFSPTPTTGWGLGKGQVTPSKHPNWDTQGMGSFWRPVEASIHFVGLGDGPLTSAPPEPGIPIPTAQIDRMNQAEVSGYIDPTITNRKIDPSDSSAEAPTGWMPPDDERAVQAFFLVSFINPAHSRITGSSRMWMRVTGLENFAVSEFPLTTWKSMQFPATASMLVGANLGGDSLGAGPFFGYMPINALLSGGGYTRSMSRTNVSSGFPLYSGIVALPAGRASSNMAFSGGTIHIELFDISDGPNMVNTNPNAIPAGANKVQEYTITFPPTNVSNLSASALPLPGLTDMPLVGTTLAVAEATNPTRDTWGRVSNADRWGLPTKSVGGFDGRQGRGIIDGIGIPDKAGRQTPDVVQSMVLSNQYGDARLLANNIIPAAAFSPHPLYGTASLAYSHLTGTGLPLAYHRGGTSFGSLISNADYSLRSNYIPTNFNTYPTAQPPVSPHTTSVSTWDWDNGIGSYPDGPWINKADEGTVSSGTNVPYFHRADHISVPGQAFFSPNRQVSSPGMLGSLPTGVKRGQGWQTLLFRPAPSGHPSAGSPPDHLWMDLFWMPVVEPYAISEPFSTAGKINMNQQMVPFTYIKRYTGLHAAMMGEKVTAMPRDQAGTYKTLGGGDAAGNSTVSRLPINLDREDGTFRQLDQKFNSGEIFRSATEICDLYLVPEGYTIGNFPAEWYNAAGAFAMVGDNSRERPYANIYGKLTTKSNTFTVHYQAQALRKSVQRNRDAPTKFSLEAGDSIVADQRGSTTFERYIDPADPRLSSDPATSGTSLEPYYRVRVVSSSIFTP